MLKDTRIEFRSSPADKNLFEIAAELTGVNVSVFLRNAAVQAARHVVEENETAILTNRDRDLLLKSLDKPPVPSSALKAAMKKYRQWK